MWDACRMPWAPELFSAPALARLEKERQHEPRVSVPYYAGLLTGEILAATRTVHLCCSRTRS